MLGVAVGDGDQDSVDGARRLQGRKRPSDQRTPRELDESLGLARSQALTGAGGGEDGRCRYLGAAGSAVV
jgi:hypothetical protein